MLFLVGIVLGGLIAAARLAHQSGTLATGWYRAFVAAAIAVGLVIAARTFIERMEAAEGAAGPGRFSESGPIRYPGPRGLDRGGG